MDPEMKWIRRRLRRVFWTFGAILRRMRGTAWENRITQALGQVRAGYDNASFDMARNGETWLLKRMARLQPRLFLDVGANRGSWSLAAAQYCPSAVIHAFEPVPDTYESLVATVKDCCAPQIHAHQIALGDHSEQLRLWVPERTASNAVVTAYPIALTGSHQHTQGRWIDVPVRRGREVLEECGISSVDLLKIDAEGFDLNVLRGFGEALRQVRVIQFEYAAFAVKPGFFLYHYYDLLTSMGFCVGRLFPKRVHIMPYAFNIESIHGGVFVAYHHNDAEIHSLLSA